MKCSLKTVIFPALILLSAYLSSCKKSPVCGDVLPITINHNGPVVEGWPMVLEAEFQSSGYTYKWSGPNGWKSESSGSDAWQQLRENVTAADGGEYTLRLVEKGCVVYEGKVTIEVTPPPAPTCNIAANTSTSSVAGVGSYTFNYRNWSTSTGFYDISGSQVVPGGDNMRFSFLGTTPPLPGIYKTSGYWATAPGKAGLYISAGTYDFLAQGDQTVYVNKVNGKIEVSFCSLRFNNPLSPANPFTVSARMVQP